MFAVRDKGVKADELRWQLDRAIFKERWWPRFRRGSNLTSSDGVHVVQSVASQRIARIRVSNTRHEKGISLSHLRDSLCFCVTKASESCRAETVTLTHACTLEMSNDTSET